MTNYVKNSRKNYYKHLGRIVTEVLVQFKDEDPSWIPLDTYESMPGIVLSDKESSYWKGELEGEEFNWALDKYGYEYTPPNFPSRY